MQRIKYKTPPLVEVIFQLRFPTILSLNTQDPVEFQEKIRDRYPFYRTTSQEVKETRPNGQERIIRVSKNHEFVSKDKTKKINIESTFISFSTHSYNIWEEFQSEVTDVLKDFIECYHPSFYTRIGLRYIDIIQRSKWNLEGSKWSELIMPKVLGFMNDETESYKMEAVSNNGDGLSSTRYHFELARIKETNEKVLLIDCDYFQKGTVELNDCWDIANRLHQHSSNFIQSAITETLSSKMGILYI